MKKIFILLAITCIAVFAQANPVNSQLESVKVFLDGAQIFRKAQAQIPSGISEVVITNLPVNIDPNSIQLRGTGDFTILAISHRINHLESPQISKELRLLNDSLEYYKTQIEIQQAILKIYEEEESLLMANKSVSGSETGLKVSELRLLADFFRTRLGELKQNQITTRKDLQKIQDRHNRVRNQIGQLSPRLNAPVGQIVITTSSQRAQRGNFDFSFITRQAGWHPVYDIRSEDINKPINLLMKANVFQNTGEDWNNVMLTLSTGSPSMSGQKPQLGTWFLRFLEPVYAAPKRLRESRPMPEMLMDVELQAIIAEDVIIDISETQTTVEYNIRTPYSVPTGNKHQLVDVQRFDISAVYEYYVVPKLDTDVYLVGKLTGWEEFVRLPGEANLFFEGTYVGKTHINPAAVRDTLEVSLGRDRGIVVERNRLTDHSRKGVLGRRIVETVAWEIVVRNNKQQPVTLNIQDQIPVSTDADIQVTMEERSGANYDEARGLLTWRTQLKPAENTKKNLRYSVRYPSDRKVVLE